MTTTLRTGPAAALLAVEAARLGADVIVVGSHGQGRLAGRLLGSVATRVVHDAACSILIARPAPNAEFPLSIVVGVDESEPSMRALAVAGELSRRTGAPLDPVHALDNSPAAALVERPRRTTSWWSARAACEDCGRSAASARRSPTGPPAQC